VLIAVDVPAVQLVGVQIGQAALQARGIGSVRVNRTGLHEYKLNHRQL